MSRGTNITRSELGIISGTVAARNLGTFLAFERQLNPLVSNYAFAATSGRSWGAATARRGASATGRAS
jgi:hypothetical protein